MIDAHWDKVTELFLSQDSKTKKFRLPGLNFPLEHYQAAAVVWLLLRIHEDKVAAAMLADDMGLGKTFTMIAAIMVHYYTQLAFTEVKIFWHHLELGFQPPRNHNVQDAPEGQKCPSTQPNPVNLPNRFCLQCPCEAGSIARRIAESMSNMPSIIICPSKGATIWIEEWDKFVNSGMRRFEPMQLYVGISDYLEPKKLLADFCRDVVDGQLDDMGEQEVEGKLVFRRRTGFDGGSRHVLLLTQEATSRQLGQKPLFEKVNVTGLRANRAKNHEGNTQAIVGCAIMVMDELHEYKGATKTTGPFKFLEKFEHQVTPTLAVGLSGNALSIGPSGWRLLVQHTQRCIKRHQMQDVKLGRIAVSKAYSALTGDWNFIQENQDVSWRAPNMQNRVLGQVQLRKEKIRADFRDGIGKMIIRRTKKDMFRGQKILDLADPVYQEEQLMIPEGRALNSLRHYYQQIRHWALAEHKLMEQAWLDGGQKGPKPTLAKAQQGVLIEKNNDNTGESAAKKKGKGKGKGKGKDKDPDATKAAHEAFYRAVRAVTFPDLARVFRSHNGQDLRPYLESGNPDLGNIATMFTNVTLDPKRTDKAVGDMLKESPFHTYRTAIRSGSPKYAKLCELIKAQLIDTRKKSVDGKELRRNRDQPADDAPGDGSHVRHMVVFTDAPITAYLTALYLQGEFLGQVDVSLIHAGLPARSASAVKHWLSREATFKRFNENCRPDSKTKILVGTYQLIATMYNIQRASSAVLMDVGTEVERQQAQDRIYRRGQTCTVLITEVWYENHVYERTRRRRNKGTQQMSEINWDEFAIDNVGGDEGDSVLPQDTSGL
ncbi:acetolactate synthase catalytic subunit protein [Apiospora arundinis]|uniref:Acetolactate synthase catalytic subunit protein n=1 Tax=Apiospora arundinis TaxID=335852 RepID=A0ABR2JGX1_9PEZI